MNGSLEREIIKPLEVLFMIQSRPLEISKDISTSKLAELLALNSCIAPLPTLNITFIRQKTDTLHTAEEFFINTKHLFIAVLSKKCWGGARGLLP